MKKRSENHYFVQLTTNNQYIMNLHSTKIFLTVIILAIATGCSEDENQESNEQASVRTVAAETIIITPDQFDDYIRISGVIEAIEDATVSAEVSGRILSIAERGATINEGEVIAQLDDRLIQAQFQAAKTGFELAQDTYERLESLHADSIISTQDFNSAKAQRDQAKAQLDQAEKQLRDSAIEAPFSGRVEERFIQRGELINPGMPVLRLVNTNRVRVLTGIPERFSGYITEGSEAQVSIQALPGQSQSTTLSYTGNVIDPDTRTFTAEVELDNQGDRLKPEMIVNLRIKRSTLSDAIIIPRTAVLRNEEGVSVFTAVEENGHKVARLVNIQTGQASGALIEVVDGLQSDDEVVISGMNNISDGDRLNILNTETSIERAEKLKTADRPFVSF